MISDLGFGPIPDLPGALCAEVDPELFFPPAGANNAAAKKVCQRCPVREDCLNTALAHGDRHGIWGGLSERQRRAIEKGGAA